VSSATYATNAVVAKYSAGTNKVIMIASITKKYDIGLSSYLKFMHDLKTTLNSCTIIKKNFL
jgi:hypothetical protein